MARQLRKKSGTGIYHVMVRGINRLHLLLREQEEEVSDVVKRIGVTYAHYFNKKYERSGHLFQDRFRSEPVDSLEYLGLCSLWGQESDNCQD